MIGAIFLITDVLFGGVVATVATVAIGAVFAWSGTGSRCFASVTSVESRMSHRRAPNFGELSSTRFGE
jgi:hypothetical protein